MCSIFHGVFSSIRRTCAAHAHTWRVIFVFAMLSVAGRAGSQMETGWYTGNGTSQSITGVGFIPEIVIIKGDTYQSAVMRTDSMTGDNAKDLSSSSSLQAGLITSLDTDGFSVGGDYRVNKGPMPFYTYYYWAAFNAEGYQAEVGTYTGDGAASKTITTGLSNLGYAIVLPAGGEYVVHRSSSMTKSYRFWYCNGTGDAIGSVSGSSFTVGQHSGTGVNLNVNGATYHYAAFKQIDGEMEVGSYTGNGQDNRTISGLGFTPEYLIVKCDDLCSSVHRPASLSGDWTLDFMDVSNFQNGIQAFIYHGFQVGSDYRVNDSGDTCYWIAFKSTYTAAKLASFEATGLADRVLIEWKTDTEVDTAGFNVLRAESPDGPWEKLNDALIPSEGNSWGGASYTFSDESREPGTVYWYCIEEVDASGGTERYPAQLVWDDGLADDDQDGLPDTWEQSEGIDTGSEEDANADADQDGSSNLEEYLSGTSPVDAGDCPGPTIERDEGRDLVVLSWPRRPGRTYTLMSADSLPELLGGSGKVLSAELATSENRMRFEVPPGPEGKKRFYRLIILPPR